MPIRSTMLFALTLVLTAISATAFSPSQAPARMPGESSTAQLSAASVFDQLDKNSKGKVYAQEVCDYLVKMGPYTHAVARSIFERLDVQRKGHLLLEELERGIQEHNLFGTRSVPSMPVNDNGSETPLRQGTKENNKLYHQSTMTAIGGYTKKHRRQKKRKQSTRYHQQAKRFFGALQVGPEGFLTLEQLREHFHLKRMEAVARRLQSQGSALTKTTAWKYSEPHLLKVFRIVDTNDDGRISLSDLEDAFAKHPSLRHAFQA